MSTELALAQIRPWGASLRPVTVGRTQTFVETPSGHLFDTVRDAFWGEHMDMCMCEDHGDQLELIRVTLRCVAEEMHRIDPAAMIDEIFAGSELFLRHMLLDLGNRGMLEHEGTIIKHARLSSVGWSVLAMLEATKPVIIEQGKPVDARSAAIQRAEQ